jgi:hypothetical protein
MTLTLADLDRWDPNAIHSVFRAAIDRANGVRSTATQVGDVMATTPWEGDSRDAAMQAAGRVNNDLISHAEECEAVGRAARAAEAELRDVQSDWHNIQHMADRWGIAINTETGELSYLPPPDPKGRAEMEHRVDIVENEIKALLVRARGADDDLAAAIRVAAGQESVSDLNQQLGDRPPAPMNEQRGNADATELLQNGTLGPEAHARLSAATALTPDQQAALERGDLVLPHDQLAYLSALSRGLDGKTTDQLRDLTLKPGGDRLVDAMRLATNVHISSTPDASGARMRAGLANAPSALRGVLNDPTLRVDKSQWEFLVAKGDEGFDPRVLFTHWDGLKDMAVILGQGNPALMRGSELDSGLLGKSGEALRWMNTGVWSGEAKDFAHDMTGDIQTMLAAPGRDPMAVHDLVAPVTGADGSRGINNDFLHDVLTHQWTDGGAAASNMLTGVPAVAQMTDPADPTQQVIAGRAGETVHAFDRYAATHRDELLNIPGTDKLSLGQLSPDLTRALASANAPYIDDMMNNKLDTTAGFQPLDDIINDPRIDNTRNLFGVLDTDSVAAHTLNTAAYGDINAYQQSFADAIKNGTDPQFFDLKSSGALRGVIDMGANIAANDTISDANDAAKAAYANRQLWFDAAKHLPGFGEFVDRFNEIPGAGDELKDMFIGPAPVPIDPAQAPVVNTDYIKHSIAERLVTLNAGDAGVFGNLVDPATGQLQPLTMANVKTMTNAVDKYLDQFGIDMNTAVDGYREYYEHSTGGK